MTADKHTIASDFTRNLRRWRKQRKMSQLDLALAANVSQRHVSWLETGRSRPSREMVLRLSEAMEVPLRDRNQILHTAGFAPVYSERKLDEPTMLPILNVLKDMLEHHEPYPAFVLDRHWNIKMKNQAAGAMIRLVGDPSTLWQQVSDDGQHNIALLTIHPDGLRQYISNWEEVAGPFVRRLKREAMESGDAKMMERCNALIAYAGDLSEEQMNQPLLPILPLEFKLGELTLSLFSVISTFGTPQDITTDELRIETFYPTNDASARFFSDMQNVRH